MSAGIFYILPERISLSYSILQMRLSDLPRKKPPPAEVADVYESDRCRLILSSFYGVDRRPYAGEYEADGRKQGDNRQNGVCLIRYNYGGRNNGSSQVWQ